MLSSRAGLGAATPGLEPVHEETEPRTDDASGEDSAAAEGKKKKSVPAKRKRAAAAKRGQTEGPAAAKGAPLAPARQALPPSGGCVLWKRLLFTLSSNVCPPGSPCRRLKGAFFERDSCLHCRALFCRPGRPYRHLAGAFFRRVSSLLCQALFAGQAALAAA